MILSAAVSFLVKIWYKVSGKSKTASKTNSTLSRIDTKYVQVNSIFWLKIISNLSAQIHKNITPVNKNNNMINIAKTVK